MYKLGFIESDNLSREKARKTAVTVKYSGWGDAAKPVMDQRRAHPGYIAKRTLTALFEQKEIINGHADAWTTTPKLGRFFWVIDHSFSGTGFAYRSAPNF